MDFLEKLLWAVIPLFVAIDPIGLVPYFLAVTRGVDSLQRKRIGRQAICTAALVAIGFMVLGKATFRVLGITDSDFKIAGGIILLVLAVKELLSQEELGRPLPHDFGVVPLGLPLIVGPATLTTLLILLDSLGMMLTLSGFLMNLSILFVAFRFAEKIASRIGITGLRAASKIVSLLLAAIAVNMIRRGWQFF